MSKRTVRLTESDLKNIIKESVERILNEGKTVNNKLIFDKYNGKEKAKPGERTDSHPLFPNDDYFQNFGYDNEDDFMKKTIGQRDIETIKRINGNFEDGVIKHNDRLSKYDEMGKPKFGEEYYDSQFKKEKREKRNEIKRFLRMLRLNKITREEFNNSSKEEKKAYWDKLYNREWQDMENERQETAYWNNLMDMAYGPNGW